jgi:TonB-linked SusC/RagA family outer membrane protein
MSAVFYHLNQWVINTKYLEANTNLTRTTMKMDLQNLQPWSRFYFLLILACVSGGALYGQTTVTGMVTDEKNEALPGVSVVLQNSLSGTTTDVNGKYTLPNVPQNATIVFSFTGMVSQKLAVNNRSVLDVVMNADVKALNEVVVIGYGTLEKKDLSSAISKVDGELLRSQPLASAAALLVGKSTGVQVTSNSGAPGSGVTVRIRGASSLSSGGNDPLYVIDGVPTDNILGVNPNDIESIEVLKDAASSAIYGSRAANGVVLISTKRGTKGRTEMSFDSYYGLQRVYKRIPMMNAQEQWEYVQKGITNFNRLNPQNPVSVRAQAVLDHEAGYDTDWQDQIFRTAPVQSYDFSANGGTDRTRFSSNIGYYNQEGVVLSNGFQRVVGKFSMDFDLTKYLTIGGSFRGNYSVTDKIPDGDSQASIMANMQRKMAYEPIFEPDGSYANRERPNVVAAALEYKGKDYQAAGIGAVYAKLKILKNLEFNSSWAADFFNDSGDSFFPSIILGGATRPSSAFANRGLTWLSENVLSYALRTGKVNFSGILGYSMQESQSFNFSALASGGPTDLIETMNASVLRERTNSYKTGWGLTSMFSRVNMTYAGKYIVSASMRRDGSSRFGKNNQYAYFPAASVAWRVNEESFLRDIKEISELKIRASYGRTGNQNIGNFVAQGTYTTGANYNGQSGVRIGGIPSADLSWETTNQADIGLDLGLFSQRLSLSIDLYRKITNGLLFSMPLPQYTGFGSYWTNLGEIENSGLELSINGDVIRSGNLTWSGGANISFNKNKVNQLPNGNPILVNSTTEVFFTSNATFRTEEGLPIGQFYGLRWTGEVYATDEIARAHVSSIVGQAPVGGTLKYEDFNGDGKIDANDRQIIGNPQPKFFGGFNTQVTWKNFDLGLQFSFVYGNKLFNQMRFLSSRGFAYDAARKERINAWSEPGQITTEHKVLTATDARDNQFSSKYIEDASYLRLNNLNFGYNFPEKLSNSLNIQRLRIYFSAQNLLTFTKYLGYDPEVNAKAGDIRTQGVDIGMIPQVSSYMLGLNLKF